MICYKTQPTKRPSTSYIFTLYMHVYSFFLWTTSLLSSLKIHILAFYIFSILIFYIYIYIYISNILYTSLYWYSIQILILIFYIHIYSYILHTSLFFCSIHIFILIFFLSHSCECNGKSTGLRNRSKRVRTPVPLLCLFSDEYPWERFELPYPPINRLNSTTTVLLKGWIWQ